MVHYFSDLWYDLCLISTIYMFQNIFGTVRVCVFAEIGKNPTLQIFIYHRRIWNQLTAISEGSLYYKSELSCVVTVVYLAKHRLRCEKHYTLH